MREKLIALLKSANTYCPECGEDIGLNRIKAIADHLLANGVVVQRHGEWLTKEDYWTMDTIYRCSACKEDFVTIDGETPTENLWRYCPNCGAKMDGDT